MLEPRTCIPALARIIQAKPPRQKLKLTAWKAFCKNQTINNPLGAEGNGSLWDDEDDEDEEEDDDDDDGDGDGDGDGDDDDDSELDNVSIHLVAAVLFDRILPLRPCSLVEVPLVVSRLPSVGTTLFSGAKGHIF